MEGYSNLFNSSENEFLKYSNNDTTNLFRSFRNQKTIYGYIDNGDISPDNEAISLARSINSNIFNYYMNEIKNRKHIGYEGSSSTNANFTHVDSRHIMMNTIIYNHINEKLENIIEIGGGYANWLYLNRNRPIKKWTIIDLPHLIRLQKWCLDELEVNNTKYELVSAYDYDNLTNNTYDLVVGSHSLSEISLNAFINYFNKIIKNSKYLFYSYHKIVHYDMVNIKRNIIEGQFNLVYEVTTENGNVSNCLFVNKNKA